MSKRLCPACGQQSSRERGEKNGLLISSCPACATLYAHRRHDDGAGAEQNEVTTTAGEDYDSYYHEANLFVPDFIDRRLDEIVAEFNPYRETNRLLDIGCGAGSLLQAARRAGWEAEGMEVSRPAVEHVRRAGFKVFRGELNEAKYADAHFDVVTASEILEHLPDPQAMLTEIARILRPGGLFWGTTPHGRGMSARLLGLRWSAISPPEHLQLFSLAGLRRMLKAAGFRRSRVTSRGVNPAEIWQALRSNGESAGGDVEAHGEESDAGDVPGDLTDNFTGNERVSAAYRLNERLTRNTATRLIKATLNGALGASRLGDSIKISAEK